MVLYLLWLIFLTCGIIAALIIIVKCANDIDNVIDDFERDLNTFKKYFEQHKLD